MPSPRRVAAPPVVAGSALRNIRVVLVRPRGAANVGSAARALRNCGVGDLVLVRPALRNLAAAERMAVHARELLRAAPVVDDVAAAIADCGMVIGTTCRQGGYRSAVLDLETLAPQVLAQATSARVALLFGPEDHGLNNDDLRHCQHLLRVDTDPAYESLNLAQAVLLVCHALRRTGRGPRSEVVSSAPASAAALDALYVHLERALGRIGFLNRQNPGHIMFTLRGVLGRSAPSPHEVRTLRGVARQIEWIAGRELPAEAAPVAQRVTPTAAARRSRQG